MQNVVDNVSLRLTAAGWTRTDTVVLFRLDSDALERKVYTGCVQAHAVSAGSRAVVSRGRTCAHPARATLQLSILDVMNDLTNIYSALRGSVLWNAGICPIDEILWEKTASPRKISLNSL